MNEREQIAARLETDAEFRKRFSEAMLGHIVLEEFLEQRDQIRALRAQGGANGNLAEELAQARERIAELEEQLASRDENQEGEDEHLPFWDIVTAEIERLPKQTVAGLDAEADKLLRHRAGGILSAHLRGEFNRAEFRKRLRDQLQEITQGKAVIVRRTSPTPAPAATPAAGKPTPLE